MRIVSWNVNGLRSAVRGGFLEWLRADGADVVALQEVRALPEQLPPEVREPDGYRAWFHPAERKGYSGVALLSRTEPAAVTLGGLGEARFDAEGRLVIADYGAFLLYAGYFPNGGRDLERVPFKLDFSEAVLRHAERERARGRPAILCGDVNTAHREVDLENPRSNRRNTGFLPEERAWIDRLLAHGYVDVLRERHPDEPGLYTWWSNRPGVRERNVGWRIDVFYVASELADRVTAAAVHPGIMGSDHCPISLEITT